MINDYTLIRRMIILKKIVTQTRDWLYEVGKSDNEAFVLWAGVFLNQDEFLVKTAIFPEQEAFRTPNGVGVYVSGTELHRISRWIYDNQVVLISQVHSHPTEAYHSDTDDNFPMVTAAGQFSIVVPFFARNQITSLNECAIYRLNEQGEWGEIFSADIDMIFEVVEEWH
jgi:hypothetical protein